ncbi:MAG: hypothetical protein M3R12_02710, partial [Actinomycetota bacterium]|nr:hypothetical protein [Actinomycetota bacterium]
MDKRYARVAALIALAATVLTLGATQRGTAATSVPAMIEGVAAGVEVRPLISVNDKVGSFSFETIPDGLAVSNQGKNVHVYVNHETSLVPFP